MKRCIQCGTECAGGVCPHCGADLDKGKKNTKYFITLAALSKPYKTLRSASVVSLMSAGLSFVFGLLLGSVVLASVPLMLASIAVGRIAISGMLQELFDGIPDDDDGKLSSAPANLFTAAVILRAAIYAIVFAVCVSVTIGGKSVIDNLFALFEQSNGVTIASLLESAGKASGVSVTLNMLYMSVYLVSVAGMFVFGLMLVLNAFELVFLSSYRESAKSGKPCFRGMGLFYATLLINGIISIVMAVFAGGFIYTVLYASQAYLYICAFLFYKRVKEFFQ